MQDQQRSRSGATAADGADNKAWGVRAGQESPDLTIHLGVLGANKTPAPFPNLALHLNGRWLDCAPGDVAVLLILPND